jgi:hypothetical protein
MARAVIVSTLKDSEAVLEYWIRYHLEAGFAHLYLFFDDANDASIEIARKFDAVTAIVSDADLHKLWESTSIYSRPEDFNRRNDGQTGVMTRQCLNVEVAISMALDAGFDWITHIDLDELFYSPVISVAEHFDAMNRASIDHITYLNYEAIPESSEVSNFFRDVTLFKPNPGMFPGGKPTAQQKQLLDSISYFKSQFFLSYPNGKSAARLRRDLISYGVHYFRLAAQEFEPKFSVDPAILHYPCCGFDHFWQKYTTLGPIPDKWYGHRDIRSLIGPFHLDSRDVVMAGNKDAARAFFSERVMLTEPSVIEALIDAKLLVRITDPSTMMS